MGQHRRMSCAALRIGLVTVAGAVVLTLAACGGEDGDSSAGAAQRDTERGVTTAQEPTSADDELELVLPVLLALNDAGVKSAQLFTCGAQSCLASRRRVLATKVDRANRSLTTALSRVSGACLQGSLVSSRVAFRAYQKGALQAQGGQKSRMAETLNEALDLSYVARDRMLACGSDWPEGVQVASLALSDHVAKITAVNDVLSACKTEDCVREQGGTLEETAGDALAEYETMLERFDSWREQAPRCRKIQELTRSMFKAFQRYGRATRIFDPVEALEAYAAVNQLVVQRQQQLQTCLSG